MANLNLKKFDMSKIPKGSVIGLIGKRNTGKSFLVKDLLYYKRDVPIGTVISASEGSNKFYSDMMPSLFVHEDYSPEVINNLVKRQKLVTKKMEDQIRLYGKTNIDPYAFLIMDDMMFDANRWLKDTNIKEIFMNGRHFNLMFLITMQFSLGMDPVFRGQLDYVFILRENIVSNRKRLYDHYAGMFPTFEIFCQVMNQCTENYECLIIDNTSKSNNITEQVYWYKADPHPPFKLGAPEFWQFHSQNVSNNTEEEDETMDFKKATAKKIGGINICVNKQS